MWGGAPYLLGATVKDEGPPPPAVLPLVLAPCVLVSLILGVQPPHRLGHALAQPKNITMILRHPKVCKDTSCIRRREKKERIPVKSHLLGVCAVEHNPDIGPFGPFHTLTPAPLKPNQAHKPFHHPSYRVSPHTCIREKLLSSEGLTVPARCRSRGPVGSAAVGGSLASRRATAGPYPATPAPAALPPVPSPPLPDQHERDER